MVVESKLEEAITNNGIIEKYFRNKHVLLIYLAKKGENRTITTVIDIKRAFNMTKKYAWTLLEKLEEDNLVEKSEKVTIERVEYHSYIITTKAKRDLEILSLYLNKYYVYCQRANSSGCPYSNEFRTK